MGNGSIDEIVLCRRDPVLKKEVCITKKKRNEIDELIKNGWKKQSKGAKSKLPDNF